MKKILTVFGILSVLVILSSCATGIKVVKEVPKYELKNLESTPKMDFIGYKIDTNILSTVSGNDAVMSEYDQAKAISNTKSLRQLGYNLENNGIASDRSDLYFGIYSLQEIELYKSQNRYVTFIEVANNKLICDENKTKRAVFAGIGGGIAAGASPMLLAGLAFQNDQILGDLASNYLKAEAVLLGISIPFLFIGALPTKTEVKFTGSYNIYIYDTQTKSLIRKEPVLVNCSETFEGSYSYDERSMEIIQEYVSQNVYNSLMEKYDELVMWLNQR